MNLHGGAMKRKIMIISAATLLFAGIIFLVLSVFGRKTDMLSSWYLPLALACVFGANLVNSFRTIK